MQKQGDKEEVVAGGRAKQLLVLDAHFGLGIHALGDR